MAVWSEVRIKIDFGVLEGLRQGTLYSVATATGFILLTGHFQHPILPWLNVLSGLAGFLLFRL